MSTTQKRVVFLLHNDRNSSIEENIYVWERNITVASKILMFLNTLRTDAHLGTRYYSKQNSIVDWSFQVVKNESGALSKSSQGFQELTSENIQTFVNDIRSSLDSGTYNAHALRDSLSMMIHDYKWEDTQILSPLKRPFSKFGTNKRPHFQESRRKTNANYVFVVGPVPMSSHDVDEYFEWNINSCDDIQKILMPPHLATHFRERHDIHILWVNTRAEVKF